MTADEQTTGDQPAAFPGPALDTATRQRLEQIIEGTSMPDYEKQELFAHMQSGEKARQYEEQQQRRVQQNLNERIEKYAARLRKRMSKKERDTLLWELGKLHYDCVDPERITHPAMEEIFRGTYKLAVERDLHLALHLGKEHLHLPAEQLLGMREELFYGCMLDPGYINEGHGGDGIGKYLDTLKGWTENVPVARQQQLAKKAYPVLLKDWSENKAKFTCLFQAALLAREYNLGREKVLEPIKRYFSFYETAEEMGNLKELISRDFKAEDYRPPSYDFLEKLIEAFDLPASIVHKQMRRLFSIELHGLHYQDTALRMMARNILTEDEITRMVNENYLETLEGGNFTSALGIREKLGQYIEQKKVGLEDLRLLARIEKGVRRE